MIEVVDYDEAWIGRFETERALLERVLAPWLEGGIHHIGSTAIPGIKAKPTVDLLPLVADLAVLDACEADIRALGYDWAGELRTVSIGRGSRLFSLPQHLEADACELFGWLRNSQSRVERILCTLVSR